MVLSQLYTPIYKEDHEQPATANRTNRPENEKKALRKVHIEIGLLTDASGSAYFEVRPAYRR